jgi:hypothetical protein
MINPSWIDFLREPRTAREFAQRFGCSVPTARQIFTQIAKEHAHSFGSRQGGRGPRPVTFQVTILEVI